jgi:hypothetical protein
VGIHRCQANDRVAWRVPRSQYRMRIIVGSVRNAVSYSAPNWHCDCSPTLRTYKLLNTLSMVSAPAGFTQSWTHIKTIGRQGCFVVHCGPPRIIRNPLRLRFRFCGEGAPDWAVLPYLNESAAFPLPIAQPYNLTSSGYPSRSDCLKSSFALYYPTSAVGNAFQDFYTNTHGLADAFAMFWSTVAKYFQFNQYVLSYELLNEVRRVS